MDICESASLENFNWFLKYLDYDSMKGELQHLNIWMRNMHLVMASIHLHYLLTQTSYLCLKNVFNNHLEKKNETLSFISFFSILLSLFALFLQNITDTTMKATRFIFLLWHSLSDLYRFYAEIGIFLTHTRQLLINFSTQKYFFRKILALCFLFSFPL